MIGPENRLDIAAEPFHDLQHSQKTAPVLEKDGSIILLIGCHAEFLQGGSFIPLPEILHQQSVDLRLPVKLRIRQKIFSADRAYNADIKVFVTDREYKADLVVYRTDRRYRADAAENKGIWFFTDRRYDADKSIFFTDREYDADLIVYFTDREYRAGWKNAAKKYLLY